MSAIKADIHMISGSADSQTSADVANTDQFRLPDPAGRAGGACTSAFLNVLYRVENGQEISWVECLRAMRSELNDMGFDQVPQLTSSHMIDVEEPMRIVPTTFDTLKNKKRAILIGINYEGQEGQLTGCHNDVRNVKKYLIEKHGFNPSEMLISMDDGKSHGPTKKNIIDSFQRIVECSQNGDVIFIHYSGHGSRVVDLDGDEDDGYDETLIPLDFKSAGQLVDDDILKILVKPIKEGVTATVLMDCCHSGSVLDLPYRFSADDDRMRINEGFQLDSLLRTLGMSDEPVAGCLCFAKLLAQILA